MTKEKFSEHGWPGGVCHSRCLACLWRAAQRRLFKRSKVKSTEGKASE